MKLEPQRSILDKSIGSSFNSPVHRAVHGPAEHMTGKEGKESVASGEGFEHCNFAKDTSGSLEDGSRHIIFPYGFVPESGIPQFNLITV